MQCLPVIALISTPIVPMACLVLTLGNPSALAPLASNIRASKGSRSSSGREEVVLESLERESRRDGTFLERNHGGNFHCEKYIVVQRGMGEVCGLLSPPLKSWRRVTG